MCKNRYNNYVFAGEAIMVAAPRPTRQYTNNNILYSSLQQILRRHRLRVQ